MNLQFNVAGTIYLVLNCIHLITYPETIYNLMLNTFQMILIHDTKSTKKYNLYINLILLFFLLDTFSYSLDPNVGWTIVFVRCADVVMKFILIFYSAYLSSELQSEERLEENLFQPVRTFGFDISV